MIKIAAFTQGLNIPSARFRIRQLIPEFAARNLKIEEYPSTHGAYPPASRIRRPFWLGAELCSRYVQLRKAREADLSILQRELISTLPTIEGLSKGPRILDIDDSIWLYRRGLAANNLGRLADHIVCGNNFLAEYFEKFGRPITIIPTAVDVNKFKPLAQENKKFRIIGWSGTSGGYEYFHNIEGNLGELLERNQDWKLRIVSDRPPPFKRIPYRQLEFIPWSVENEASSIAEMDIGLMPLDDNLWSRGKCSYKMLLYMSSGVPVVASDIGMNSDLLRMAPIGVGVSSDDGWMDGITSLIENDSQREKFGLNGRQLVEQNFSLEQVARQWSGVVSSLLPIR